MHWEIMRNEEFLCGQLKKMQNSGFTLIYKDIFPRYINDGKRLHALMGTSNVNLFYSGQDFGSVLVFDEKEIEPLNKFELTEKLKDKCHLTRQEASEVVEIFFSKMTNALINGDRVEIRGLCSFYIKKYEGYTGRNPKTGKKVNVGSKKLPFFKCGKELKERVDYPAN